MNRVLSWPHTPIFPGLLRPLKTGRHETVVTDKGCVRFDLPLGPVEMRFPTLDTSVPPGTAVYVWWKGGGFVCAPVDELTAEERSTQSITCRLQDARAKLQAARLERLERDSAMAPLDELPPPQRPDFPLLQA